MGCKRRLGGIERRQGLLASAEGQGEITSLGSQGYSLVSTGLSSRCRRYSSRDGRDGKMDIVGVNLCGSQVNERPNVAC